MFFLCCYLSVLCLAHFVRFIRFNWPQSNWKTKYVVSLWYEWITNWILLQKKRKNEVNTTQHNNTKAICRFEKNNNNNNNNSGNRLHMNWNKKQFYQIGYADSSKTLGFEMVYMFNCIWPNWAEKKAHTDTESATVFLPIESKCLDIRCVNCKYQSSKWWEQENGQMEPDHSSSTHSPASERIERHTKQPTHTHTNRANHIAFALFSTRVNHTIQYVCLCVVYKSTKLVNYVQLANNAKLKRIWKTKRTSERAKNRTHSNKAHMHGVVRKKR